MAVGALIRDDATGALWQTIVFLVVVAELGGLIIDTVLPGLSRHPLPEEETIWEPGQVLVDFVDPADARAFAAGKVLIPDPGGLPAARTTLATIHLLAEEDRHEPA
jgi:hypothetical protein